ncbi:hypothetical protein SUGI_0407880 [Cryptomeria japonica]|nr:hypothetical protein SUGI_0407880 [Cryptomeria japonica]
MDAPITQEIEERLKDLGVDDKSQETTKKKGMEDKKKESDLEHTSEAKTETDKVEEKMDIDEDKVVKDSEKEVEVEVACVDHRTYAGDEGKTEDVPVTIVHEIHGKKELPPSGILQTAGAKVMTTATGIKDSIVGKPKSSK